MLLALLHYWRQSFSYNVWTVTVAFGVMLIALNKVDKHMHVPVLYDNLLRTNFEFKYSNMSAL